MPPAALYSQAPVASLKHWPNGHSNAWLHIMLQIIVSGVPQMDGHELAQVFQICPPQSEPWVHAGGGGGAGAAAATEHVEPNAERSVRRSFTSTVPESSRSDDATVPPKSLSKALHHANTQQCQIQIQPTRVSVQLRQTHRRSLTSTPPLPSKSPSHVAVASGQAHIDAH